MNYFCESCDKSDVCQFEKTCERIMKEIGGIENRENVFINVEICCETGKVTTNCEVNWD